MSAHDTGELEPARTQEPAIPPLNDRLRYAQELAQSGLLPSAYRGRPANVLVAIETGHMLGIAPMAALHNIHIVEGKPTLSAALMAALVRRAGHTMRVWTEGDDKAVAELIRHDDPGFTYRAEWTAKRAKDAKLLGKDVWQKYQPNMLKNRAASEVCRDGAQEVFLGPVYVPEELGAAVDADGDPVTGGQEAEQAPTASAQRIDWDADLATLEGNREGLRQLGELAKQYGDERLPEGFRERYRAAWERTKASGDVVDAELVEDESCPGTGRNADEWGYTVIVKDDGTEITLCQECDRWHWLVAGAVEPHGANTAGLPGTENLRGGDR